MLPQSASGEEEEEPMVKKRRNSTAAGRQEANEKHQLQEQLAREQAQKQGLVSELTRAVAKVEELKASNEQKQRKVLELVTERNTLAISRLLPTWP